MNNFLFYPSVNEFSFFLKKKTMHRKKKLFSRNETLFSMTLTDRFTKIFFSLSSVSEFFLQN